MQIQEIAIENYNLKVERAPKAKRPSAVVRGAGRLVRDVVTTEDNVKVAVERQKQLKEEIIDIAQPLREIADCKPDTLRFVGNIERGVDVMASYKMKKVPDDLAHLLRKNLTPTMLKDLVEEKKELRVTGALARLVMEFIKDTCAGDSEEYEEVSTLKPTKNTVKKLKELQDKTINADDINQDRLEALNQLENHLEPEYSVRVSNSTKAPGS
jgi:hypothetical protein